MVLSNVFDLESHRLVSNYLDRLPQSLYFPSVDCMRPVNIASHELTDLHVHGKKLDIKVHFKLRISPHKTDVTRADVLIQ
ncbi:hypothetical protein OLMES_2405 [Oleiphilus messinensis]|uniref:Uncharacterized protein n=1 Tax=Oleiphilus messinensis TaxID=141451 RepID=A0A1Y0I9M8_9GAMM|nr:hypothetical protein OLMES_2405 [Oleiphilus messinensis]